MISLRKSDVFRGLILILALMGNKDRYTVVMQSQINTRLKLPFWPSTTITQRQNVSLDIKMPIIELILSINATSF